MGYTTDFMGQVSIDPPLNKKEVKFLQKFNKTRRMLRKKGPYYVNNKGFAGQDNEPDIIDYNSPPEGQPISPEPPSHMTPHVLLWFTAPSESAPPSPFVPPWGCSFHSGLL